MDIESLLFRTASEPLGPFSMSYEAASPEAWALTITLDGVTRTIRAEPEPRSGGLVLSCPVDAVTAKGPWVSTISTSPDGKKEQSIWLHGDGLSTALLISALAELTRAAAADKPAPKPLLEPVHIPIPTPPPPPDPVPVERPRPLDWQTFSPAPAETTAGAAKEPEPVTPEPVEATVSATPDETLGPATPIVAESTPAMEPVVSAAEEVAHGPEPPVITPTPVTSSEETKPVAPVETKDIEEKAPQPVAQSGQPSAADPPRVTGKTGNCFECGSPYAADHAFCTNCGARLIAAGSN
jgi:hypothetical protein